MMQLKIGDKAPDFSGKDQNGKTIQLSDYSGKKIAIYFYPKDNTPGCTVQACNLRDNDAELQKAGVQIIGVSADSSASHVKFIDKFSLPFPLIADEDKTIIQQFGVWGPKKFMGKEYDGIHRTTFIIDENKTIIGIIEKPKTKEHAEEILALLK
ncbi:MAG: thioredoxin-dependent thiol peroxidase [Crocinitomicaceae bacterium]|nr:thioredoxin-dependent thiol peroxidase [Crocinitomicaceae bacterium]